MQLAEMIRPLGSVSITQERGDALARRSNDRCPPCMTACQKLPVRSWPDSVERGGLEAWASLRSHLARIYVWCRWVAMVLSDRCGGSDLRLLDRSDATQIQGKAAWSVQGVQLVAGCGSLTSVPAEPVTDGDCPSGHTTLGDTIGR